MKIPKKTKRFSVIFLLTLAFTTAITISYKFYTDTVYCTDENLATEPVAIMFGASWCPYCFQARRYFVNNKVSYCEYDIEDSGKGEELYSRIINNGMAQGIPIIFIGDYRLSGFNERQIDKILSGTKSL